MHAERYCNMECVTRDLDMLCVWGARAIRAQNSTLPESPHSHSTSIKNASSIITYIDGRMNPPLPHLPDAPSRLQDGSHGHHHRLRRAASAKAGKALAHCYGEAL